MELPESLRRERDRFVAFSFASADLLMEIDASGKLSYVSGAVRAVTGHDAPQLIGQPHDLLLAARDRAMIRQAVERLATGGRLVPIAVTLSQEFGGAKDMVLGGCRLPDSVGEYYLTLSSPRVLSREDLIAAGRDPETGLPDEGAFEQRAAASLREAVSTGKDVALTLLELTGLQDFTADAGATAASQFMADIGALLQQHSLNGATAGRLAEGKFGIVHARDFDAATLGREVQSLAHAAAPDARPLSCEPNTVDLSPGSLSEEEAVKALVFTLGSFAKSDGKTKIDSLHGAFNTLLKETVEKFKSYKTVVSDSCFELVFQPIVDLSTGAVRHFEVLARLENNRSPYEMVTFAEELGIIEQFDLLVCQRTAEIMLDEARGRFAKLAVNLSAQSLESDLMVDALLGVLQGTGLEERLIFEITESTRMKNLSRSNAAIQRLRERGYRVGLDDFGAGSASLPYLQALEIDFVKIDGAYVKEVLNNRRSALIMKAVCGLCRELGAYTVAEMVETREQLDMLKQLRVDFGQGYFFGKPSPHLESPNPSAVRGQPLQAPKAAVERRGGYRTWGSAARAG